MDYHFYEPKDGHGLAHDPMSAILAPRPIGWISSIGATGVRNLAPYSFFTMFNYKPPLIGFSSVGRKDSVRNIEETGVFCWNLATRPLAEPMNLSSANLPIEVDEFDHAGVEAVASKLVGAPRVKRSPVSMECRLCEIINLRDSAGTPTPARLVIGEVVGIHIDASLLEGGVYDTAAAEPILRAGGTGDYYRILAEGHFTMERPG